MKRQFTLESNSELPQVTTSSYEEYYDYADLIDYGDDDNTLDYAGEGGRLFDIAADYKLGEDEGDYYEHSYQDGLVRIPFNYSGLQFTKLTETPRIWDAKTAFLEQVWMKLYMFIPAIAAGIFLGIFLWLITIFTIRSYGVLKAWICPSYYDSHHQPKEGMQMKKLDLKRIPVNGEEHMEISVISPPKHHHSFRPLPLPAKTTLHKSVIHSPTTMSPTTTSLEGRDNKGFDDDDTDTRSYEQHDCLSEEDSWLVSGGGDGLQCNSRLPPDHPLSVYGGHDAIRHAEDLKGMCTHNTQRDHCKNCCNGSLHRLQCQCGATGSPIARRHSTLANVAAATAEIGPARSDSTTSTSESSGFGNSDKCSLNDSKTSLDITTILKKEMRKSVSLTKSANITVEGRLRVRRKSD